MTTSIVLFLLGALSASSTLVQVAPSTEPYVAKLKTAQDWLGVAGFLWAVAAFVRLLFTTHAGALHFMASLAVLAVLVCNSVLYGQNLLLPPASAFFKDASLKKRADAARSSLVQHQVRLGVVSMVLGAVTGVAAIAGFW